MPNAQTPEAIFRSILDRSITEISDSDVTTIGGHKFRNDLNLKSVSFTKVTTIGGHSFRDSPVLASLNFPRVTTINDSAFHSCISLTEIDLPTVTSMSGGNHFKNCIGIVKVSLPAIEGISSSNTFQGCSNLRVAVLKNLGNASYTFTDCSKLEITDYFGDRFRETIFQQCSSLKTLILRKTASPVTLSGTGAFSNTPYASGGSGGTIYIPEVLYNHLGDGTTSDYKATTNWSTMNGYGTITWAKIEGTVYEHLYGDGTPLTDSDSPSSISVTYTGPPQYIDLYAGMSLHYLQDYITVTAVIGGTTFSLEGYMCELSGQLNAGTNIITAKVGTATTTFTVYDVLPAPGLPDGYIQLRSVYARTSNAQYINLGIPENNIFDIEYVYRPLTEPVDNATFLGTDNVNYPRIVNRSGSPKVAAKLKNGTELVTNFPESPVNKVYKVIGKFDTDKSVTVNGVSYGTVTAGSTASTYSLYLLSNGRHAGGAGFYYYANVYYVKLYQNNVLVHHYIPCVNDKGTIGIYDIVSEDFKGSATSTTLLPD